MNTKPPKDLKEFYEKYYLRSANIADIPKDDDFMYAQVLKQIRPYLYPGLKVLDLGCNNGNLSLYMARAGCEVLGIDIAQNAIDAAKRSADHYGISNAQFKRIDFLQEWNELDVFDFVLCNHVVEHVPQDDLFVKKIALATKPNGRLVLMTPTVYSFMYFMTKLLTGRFAFDEEVGHLRRYTRQTISSLIEGAGFHIDKVVFLDSILREWFIICKALRHFRRIWGRRYIRTAFNSVDTLLAKLFLCPATVCVHAILVNR